MKSLFPPVLIALLFLSGSAAPAQGPVPFSFGLSNADGGMVIIYDSKGPVPRQLHAVLPSGKTCLLNFVEKRTGRPEDTGRQTAGNFDNMAGSVFRTSGKCLQGDRTIALIDPVHLDTHEPIPVKPKALSPLANADISRIESARDRKVKSSWNLAGLSADATIALVQFLPRGKSALASLVLITKEQIVFEDYLGNTKDANSVWRVDDEGIFHPDDFHILAAFRSTHGLEIIRAWAGPEGESTVLLREDGATFIQVLTQYRYWVPL